MHKNSIICSSKYFDVVKSNYHKDSGASRLTSGSLRNRPHIDPGVEPLIFTNMVFQIYGCFRSRTNPSVSETEKIQF
jgi:hypothetical protein